MSATRTPLRDGREHFQHGPIDLIIHSEGRPWAVANANQCAWERFQRVLDELVAELPALRRPMSGEPCVAGVVGRRMVDACAPFAPLFVTPMAAVAGSVADEIIAHFRVSGITRAYVNNGGDIALHLTEGVHYRVGLCADAGKKTWKAAALDGSFEIGDESSVRGIATSGWRGRSFSLGIADSVTALATTAAQADAAATMIGNAVNIDTPAVVRRPASSLKDDTDLGDRLVTVEVGALTAEEVACALEAGKRAAQGMIARGLIHAAVLMLNQRILTVGDVSAQHHWLAQR